MNESEQKITDYFINNSIFGNLFNFICEVNSNHISYAVRGDILFTFDINHVARKTFEIESIWPITEINEELLNRIVNEVHSEFIEFTNDFKNILREDGVTYSELIFRKPSRDFEGK